MRPTLVRPCPRDRNLCSESVFRKQNTLLPRSILACVAPGLSGHQADASPLSLSGAPSGAFLSEARQGTSSQWPEPSGGQGLSPISGFSTRTMLFPNDHYVSQMGSRVLASISGSESREDPCSSTKSTSPSVNSSELKSSGLVLVSQRFASITL